MMVIIIETLTRHPVHCFLAPAISARSNVGGGCTGNGRSAGVVHYVY